MSLSEQAPPSAAASLGERVRTLFSSSGTYLIADLVARGLSFVLLPIYSRAMSPADYGVVAVATAISNLLVVFFALNLQGSVTRLMYESDDESQRRRLFGTILIYFLTVPLAIALALTAAGRAGLLEIIPSVPFRPYLELVVWSSYLSIFIQLPIYIFIARQQPRRAAMLMLLNVFAQAAYTVVFVVVLDQGALGALRALALTAATTALVSLVVCARLVALRFSRALLFAAGAFSIPLIPHTLAQWLLFLSDRAILERYVSNSKVGIYSIGYAVGAMGQLAGVALSRAFNPMITERLKAGHSTDEARELGTYAVVFLTGCGVGLAILGGPVLRLLAPPAYHEATNVVPWIVLAYVFFGIYTVVTSGLFYSMRTIWIAVGTACAGLVNVALDLVLVPKIGMMAAAIDSSVGFLLLAVIQDRLAQRIFPIPWDYGRWVKTIFAGLLVAAPLAAADPVGPAWLPVRLAAIAAFPAVLLILGVFTSRERRWASEMVRRVVNGAVRAA